MFRLFVGLELSPELRAALGGLCAGVPGARWVDDENLHVTLRFVGEVDAHLADDLAEELRFLRAPAFGLRLAGVDWFGRGPKARLLYAQVKPDPPLVHLRDKIESVCVRLGLAPEGRRFTPHVTLAHLVGGADPVRLVAFQAAHAAFAPPPEPVEAFTLFSSWALGDGRHYVPEARFPLTPR